jgi:hypothetical protein
MRQGSLSESAEREELIPLNPLNSDFPAWTLSPSQYRVIAEFLQVLYPE